MATIGFAIISLPWADIPKNSARSIIPNKDRPTISEPVPLSGKNPDSQFLIPDATIIPCIGQRRKGNSDRKRGYCRKAASALTAQYGVPPPSRPGMSLLIHILQFLLDHMGVNLGGRDIRVTQHFLKRPQVRAVLQQMGRKGMTQRMGRDFLVNARLLLIVLDNLPESLPAHALAVHIDKQGGLPAVGNQLRAGFAEVILQGFDSGAVNGDAPLPAPACAAQDARGKVQVLQVQGGQFTDTDASGVKQFQHRVIPKPFGVHAAGLFQE